MGPPLSRVTALAARGTLLFGVASIASVATAADLQFPVSDLHRIVVDVLSDTHCPFLCEDDAPRCPDPPCADSISCCDTFAAIVEHQNQRPMAQDFTFIDGDVGITSRSALEPWAEKRFFQYWGQVQGPKALGVGNHEADAGNLDGELYWPDPLNHYAPYNWWEPAYGCGPTTPPEKCRRWYAVYLGSPPRVAWFALNNVSDTSDQHYYVWCDQPNDGLHHAASPQRQWFNAEIDALPSTVEVVFVAGHRTYYGVERFCCRPNIYHSGDWNPAEPETLRTGTVSFLRDLESIVDRQPNVKRVFMISGDQHCFSETAPIRLDERDDERGVIYVTLGISGGWNNRGYGFPFLNEIPPGTLVYAFQDLWGSTRFTIEKDRVVMDVLEAYSDSLIHRSSWLFDPGAVNAPATAPEETRGPRLVAWPNPTRGEPTNFEFSPVPPSDPVDAIEVYDVTGRLVRRLTTMEWNRGTYRFRWDARDEGGRRVAAGSYFVRVSSPSGGAASVKVAVTP